MIWNYLNSAQERLLEEVLLLALSLLWGLLRLFRIISGKVRRGKPVHIKAFGKHLVEVPKENLNSEVKPIVKNI
jgi:hypothetical protein